MNKMFAFAVIAMFGLVGAVGAFALLAPNPTGDAVSALGTPRPVWTEVQLGAGRPIAIAWMKGRSRAYTLTARNPPGKTAISVVFNDRCDMMVATVVLPHDRPATIEPGVIEFLNSVTVLHWAEVTLGITRRP
jgi:hypothetical protein